MHCSFFGRQIPIYLSVSNFKQRCHPEWSEAESRDLRTGSLFNQAIMRRSFDSLRSLKMTRLWWVVRK